MSVAELQQEIRRLKWLIEWVDENASFTEEEWPIWEKLQDSHEPWNVVDELEQAAR